MTANDSKSYLSYLNKLVDQYNNTYYHSALTEKIEMNPKALTFKVNDQVRITKYKNIFSKDYTKNWFREIFIANSVLKTNPWTYKIKDLNGENITGSFSEKELLLSKLKISYYPEPDSHIRDDVKSSIRLVKLCHQERIRT